MKLRESLNGCLDKLARTSIVTGQSSRSAFRLSGLAGLIAASGLCLGLTFYKALPVWAEAAVVLTATLIFYLLAVSIKVATGKERLTYYHHQIVFLISIALLLKLMGQPVLPLLDISILGVGLLMACGRVGCLMVGCCHGRPSRWGVVYCAEHAARGFTPYYTGVRLFPVQVVEALWVFCVVAIGVILVLRGSAAGTTLGWYVTAYAAGRFCFEFLRGDAERPYLCGFSEAQWTSLLLSCATLGAALSGLLVFHFWQSVAVVSMALTMLVVAGLRRLRKNCTYELLHPRHVREIAAAIERASAHSIANLKTAGPSRTRAEKIPLAATSLGIRISASEIESATGFVRHYTFSSRNAAMTEETAETLARLILKLKHLEGTKRLVKGEREVFHLLVNNPPQVKGSLASR